MKARQPGWQQKQPLKSVALASVSQEDVTGAILHRCVAYESVGRGGCIAVKGDAKCVKVSEVRNAGS